MNERPIILIVDDSKTNRAVLKDIFADSYELREAADGMEVVEILAVEKDISLILLDINIPRMNSFEVLTYLSQDSQISKIPVIVNTEFDKVKNELWVLKLGAKDFICKPYQPEIVLLRAQNVLAQQKLAHQQIKEAEQSKQIEELSYLVERDLLTGIYNRETFCKKTALFLENNKDKKYAVVQLDIARFKVINDLFGTEVGDKVLKGIAVTLKRMTGKNGTYARLKGDHFVCCMPQEGLNVSKMIKQFEEDFKSFHLNYNIAIYAGIYPIQDTSIPIDQMCDRANLALNTIKGNYTKRFSTYDKRLRDAMLKDQYIISEMQHALEEGQFSIYLQPIYSIEEEAVVSAEALVRWEHPIKGIIMPGEFIPLFERNGFITQMDACVWEEVCKYLKKRKETGKREIPISVNVSRMNMYNPNFTEDITHLVQKYELDISLLKLEITESAYIADSRQLIATLGKLQGSGFKIMTDDFGSGYSSLNMLKDAPVDVLKIDMKFIDDLEHSSRAGNIVTSVVRMAKWLDMSIVAEGVETKQQFEFLRSIDCDDVQGYYFSKPLPLEQFEKLVDMQ